MGNVLKITIGVFYDSDICHRGQRNLKRMVTQMLKAAYDCDPKQTFNWLSDLAYVLKWVTTLHTLHILNTSTFSCGE